MPSPSPADFQLLHEFPAKARAVLNDAVWDYLIGGAETETTVRRNRLGLDSLALCPRVLVDVRNVDCRGTFLGQRIRLPVGLAPVGGLENFAPGGGATVAAAAARFGVPVFTSSVTEPSLETIAEAAGSGPKVFQLYVRGDSNFVDGYVERALAAGFDAFCFTVDTAVYSRRERDIAKRWQKPRRANDPGPRRFQAGLDWQEIERFKARHRVPLILKGIATAADARCAVDAGVDVVYVSNHGGRQLDHGRAAVDVLPEVVAAVAGRAKVYVDGGFSRGTDIIKAAALGADLVLFGRLYCYALAAGGADAIVRLLEILEEEIRQNLGLLGATSFAALGPDHLCPAPPVTLPSVLSAFPLLSLPARSPA
jgi:glycolate oxidase